LGADGGDQSADRPGKHQQRCGEQHGRKRDGEMYVTLAGGGVSPCQIVISEFT